jgi:D-alanyl-lipoteichoic acid acyltransferase DltB (MBOAT superfamily)
VSFFPQLVAGPIERASRLLPQIQSGRRIVLADLELGLFLFVSGWLRKSIGVVLGTVVDPVFGDPESSSSWRLLWALYAFAFQIYFDFSGYTDMARGIARAMGFELMENFNAPYFATNVREFWNRWHISLSGWLRDYLYIPLGGNRGPRWRVQRNLMLTMLLGGLWHGAAWNFVVWGGLHGLYLAVHRAWSARARPQEEHGKPRRVLGALVTFHLVLLAWLFFRVKPVDDVGALTVAAACLGALTDFTSAAWSAPPFLFWLVGLVLIQDVAIVRRQTHLWFATWPWWARGTLIAVGVCLAFVLGSGSTETFIYFQF